MNVGRKTDFLIFIYAPIMTFLYLDQIYGIPFTSFLRKTKYVLIALLLFLAVANKAISKIDRGDFLLFCYFLHTFLFGVILKNPLVDEAIAIHFREMLIFLIFVFGIYKYVIQSRSIKEFLEVSWKVMSGYLLFAGILHFNDFVNPIYYPYALFRYLRIRSTFGFVQYNKCAYAVYIALIVGLVLFEYYREHGLIKKNWLIKNGFIFFILLCMLFSTGGRGSILAFILTGGLYCVFLFARYKLKLFWGIAIAIVIPLTFVIIALIESGIFSNFGDITQRGMNISVNYPVFREIGDLWTGMGYVNVSGFAADIFGYDTWNIDMYYVYLFFTTGVIGCLIIGGGLLSMLFQMIRNQRRLQCSAICIPVFLGMLFAAIWDVNFFTYDNVSSVSAASLLLILCSYTKENA